MNKKNSKCDWVLLLFTAQKRSFPSRISSVHVTKSAVFCGLVTFIKQILIAKPHFSPVIPYLCNTTVKLLNEVYKTAVYAANQTSSKSSSCYNHFCQYKCIPPKDSRGTNCQ